MAPHLRSCALALVLALVLPAAAEPATYRVEPALTRAEFSVEHLGVLRAQGRFAQVTGRMVLDPVAGSGTIELEIAASSVTTGWDLQDAFIRGVTLFDADRYPEVRFRSTRFEWRGDRLVRVDGDLTLRDVTRPVSLRVRRLECGAPPRATCSAEAEGAIRRRDFAMDAWWPLIGDEVDLRFHLVAVRQ